MVSPVALRIIKRAVAIRLANGEKLENIVNEYTKLSPEQIESIKAEFVIKEA